MNSLDHRLADGSSRSGVLKVLRERGDLMRVEDLAEAVSLSLSAVRFHLDRLIADGLVRTSKEPRQTPGRPRVMYQAVPAEAVDDGAAYRHLATLLADELAGRGGSVAGEAAGKAWARSVLHTQQWPVGDRSRTVEGCDGNGAPARPGQGARPVSATTRVTMGARRRAETAEPLPECLPHLLRVLEDGGFAPQIVDGGWSVEIHRCPYADLMPGQAEVVCSVHKGLIQSLPELAGTGERVHLDPAPEGSAPCMVHFLR
jgi:predicted ArsR family transcriptional regulator